MGVAAAWLLSVRNYGWEVVLFGGLLSALLVVAVQCLVARKHYYRLLSPSGGFVERAPHPTRQKRQLLKHEIEQRVVLADQMLGLLNETDEAIAFVRETQHKALQTYKRRDFAEVHIFDLQRCRNLTDELRRRLFTLGQQNVQYEDLVDMLQSAPYAELVAGVEHFRDAFDKLTARLREGTENADFSYLIQPFLTELDRATDALSVWKIKTRTSVLELRKELQQ